MKFKSKKAFTLVEMLIVIAIIAILVAVVVPTISNAMTKAHAATDAANLRSVHAKLNAELYGGKTPEECLEDYVAPTCRLDEDARMMAYYYYPAVFEIYFVSGENYYSVEYMAEMATNGETEISTAKPTDHADGVWYNLVAAD